MRTNVFLAAAAALLAIPTIVTVLDDSRSFTSYEDVPRLFEGFTPDKIAIVNIAKVKLDENGEPVKGQNDQLAYESLRLQKTHDGWVIGAGSIMGAPVRGNAVPENVLAHFEAIRRDADALIATRGDGTDEDYETRLAEYELTENTGLLIQCFDNTRQPVAELYRGRSARGTAMGDEALRGHFVRRKDRDDVILYEVNAWKLDLDPKSWIDRQAIPPAANGKIVRAKIHNEQGDVEFKKDDPKDAKWQLMQGPEGVGPLRHSEIDAAVTRLARAQVLEYVKQLPANPVARQNMLRTVGLDAPKLFGEIEIEDGTIYRIDLGNKLTDKNEFHAVFSNRDFVVTVPGYVQTSFVRDLAQYFDPSPDSVQNGGAKENEDKGKDEGDDDKREKGK